MKKIFAFAGLMTAAVISLTNCQPKELGPEAPVGKTVRISASFSDDTKTTADGMSTLWAEGDKINLFYGSSSYVSLGEVVLAEGAGTKKAGFDIANAPSGSVKWYALYPYNSKLVTPAAQSASYTYIGHSKGLTQDGFNNTAALCGSVCPLYGLAEGEAAGLNIPMKHLASAIELNLKNNSGSDITVTSVTVTASEDIVGSYFIAIDSGSPVYTPSSDSYVKSSAIVNLENATLGKGESGKVYLAVKPYTQSESVPFKVTVKANVGSESKTAEIELNPKGAQCVFAAGKMKKVGVEISSFGGAAEATIAAIHSGTASGDVTVKDVVVTSIFPKGYFVSDGKGILYVYQNGDVPDEVIEGRKLSVSGTVSTYKGNKQIADPTATPTGYGSASLSPASWKGSNVDAAYADNNAAYVKLEMNATSGTLAKVDGANRILYFPAAQKASGVSISKDKTYSVVGYIYGHAEYQGDEEVYIYIESAEEKITSATLTVSPTSVTIPKDGGSAEATVTCDASWSVDTSTVPDWLTCTKSGNTLTFSASKNDGSSRSATVTLKHSNGSLTATVKVTQSGEMLNLSASSISFGSKDNDPIVVNVSCDNANWTIDQSTVPSWLTVTADKQSDPMTITVVAQDNTGEARNAEIVVKHSNGEITRTLKVGQNAASSGGTAKYVKITSTSSLTNGQYLIVYGEESVAMNGGLTVLDAANNNKSVTISGNSITWSGDDIYFTYNSSEQSLCGAAGAYLAHSSSSNNIAKATEYAEASCKLDISFDSDGNVIIAAPTGYNLRYNSDSGQKRFRFYKSTSTQKLIQLYKKQ